MSIEAVRQAYEDMAGSWTGCDWPTEFGETGIDLNGWTAAEAACMNCESAEDDAAADWAAAHCWLRNVERKADDAAVQGALALAAANAGAWPEAVEHARRAWVLEQEAGRPSQEMAAPSWQSLCEALEQAVSPQHPERTVAKGEPAMNLERQVAQMKAEIERLQNRVEELEHLGSWPASADYSAIRTR